MELITIVTLLLTGITVALAAPAPDPGPTSIHVRANNTNPDTADCFIYNSPLASFDHFEIKVGRPFINGAGVRTLKSQMS